MNPDINETELDRRALAISVWENEGGSRAPDTPDGQFGRRVERDRSWTVYHVFTGIPARVDGSPLTQLSRSAATQRMLSLNLRNARRRKERNTRSGSPKPHDPHDNHDICPYQSLPKFR
jgi:hypothetical protein